MNTSLLWDAKILLTGLHSLDNFMAVLIDYELGKLLISPSRLFSVFPYSAYVGYTLCCIVWLICS